MTRCCLSYGEIVPKFFQISCFSRHSRMLLAGIQFLKFFGFILSLMCFSVQNVLSDPRSNIEGKSKSGYTAVDTLSSVRDMQCSSGDENPSCSKAIGGLVLGKTPGAISRSLKLTGPFATGRSDEPAQQVFGKTVKDEMGKGITVSYKKNNGSTVHSEIKYYKFNRKAGDGGGGDKSDSSEEGNITSDIPDNAANQEISEDQSNISKDTNLPGNDIFRDNNDLNCVNPDDPHCR